MNLTQLRLDLAKAKDRLRDARDAHEMIKAICEMQIETTGKNAEDRKRELTVGLSKDESYKQALAELRTAEYAVDEIQAQIDAEEDARREREWVIRERLAAALGGQAEDAAFEQAQDRRVVDLARKAQPRKVYVPDADLPF